LLPLGDLASQVIGCMVLVLPSEGNSPHAHMAVRSSSAGSGEGSDEGGVWWRKGSSCHGGAGVRHPGQRFGVPESRTRAQGRRARASGGRA